MSCPQPAKRSPNSTKYCSSTSIDTSRLLGTLNIAHISASAFRMQAYRQENTSFSTSLYELDRLIEDKEATDDDATTEEIKLRVPLPSQAYLDTFSKAASNRLPPHRSYDHRIQLESDNTLGYSPL